MIDDHADSGPDPLSGRDPHPREQIDLWPLHDARQELLEEIVSQPGPGQSTSARRFAVPIGIAAALAIVAGGGWFVVGNDDDSGSGNDDQVVAASDSPATTDEATDVATDPTTTDEPTATETTETTEPADPVNIPVSELKKGDVLGPKQCRQLRRGWTDITFSERTTKVRHGKWSYIVLTDKNDKTRWVRLVRVGKGNHYVGVDKDCVVTSVGKLRSRN